MAPLSILQRREAARLQLQGRTLREIAGKVGATYEQVCLSLFGGIHDWEPNIGTPVVMEGLSYTITTPDRKPPSLEVVKALQPLVAAAAEQIKEIDDEEPARAVAVERAREPGARGDVPARGDTTVSTPEPEGDREPAHAAAERAAQAAPEAQAPAAAKPAAAASNAPIPGHEYYLTDEAGQWLHESLDGLTRNKRFAWKGTTKKIEVVLSRMPKWKVLVPERVA